MTKHGGFSLIEMVAVLVVILGIIAAANYYRGRPASDPDDEQEQISYLTLTTTLPLARPVST